MPTFDTSAHFSVKKFDVVYRQDGDVSLPATIYQPQGDGPFPALLDVHGGAWNAGTRAAEELIHAQLAGNGMVVMAVDFRLAPDHIYPAQVADVNYAIRWLKAHAADFNAMPEHVGGMGGSSGGTTVLLNALRPTDPRYTEFSLAEDPCVDASLSYVVALWPVLDPYVRYHYAKRTGYERLVTNTENYFQTEERMKDGNPQVIVERGEAEQMPPLLIIQGTKDDNIPIEIPERFAETYPAKGGQLEMEWFPGMPHMFALKPSPETDRAIERIKTFIVKQLATSDVASG